MGFPSKCRNGCRAGSLQAVQRGELGTLMFKSRIHPWNGVSSVWWLHFSTLVNRLLCTAKTQWYAYIQTILSFPLFLPNIPPLVFPARMVCLRLPPPTWIIPVFAVAILSLERWLPLGRNRLFWHFVNLCSRPWICFNWVEVESWHRLLNWEVALVHVWLIWLHSSSLFRVEKIFWFYLACRRELSA